MNDAKRISRGRANLAFIDLSDAGHTDPVLAVPPDPVGSIGRIAHQIPIQVGDKVYYLAAYERGT